MMLLIFEFGVAVFAWYDFSAVLFFFKINLVLHENVFAEVGG